MPKAEDDLFSESTTVARPKAVDRPSACAFVVTVLEGPDAGARFTIDAGRPSRALVGKSAACDLRLSDPSVSRRHVALELVERRLHLRDLGSTNGTTVDGVAVVEGFLVGGELVRIGASALRVASVDAEPGVQVITSTQFGSTLGTSSSMVRLYPLCAKLAASDVPLIIEGETGTGKERLAESLHEVGRRRESPFVVFDCTAVAPSLIESELFGHDRGAFTGSVATHHGVFERAHGGTLFIDEIGDLPLALQPKLLRVLDRGEITRVGGRAPVRVDVRVIAATRRDLDREVQLGRFRDDLFHRLAVVRIELPPLRARHGDLRLLAQHFWVAYGGDPNELSNDLLRRWEDYAWPGNVRELRNAVARRIALGDVATLSRGDLGAPQPSEGAAAVHVVGEGGDWIAAILALDLPLSDARQRVLDEFEQRYVERVLTMHDGNMNRAAAAAGVARRHFQRLKARGRRDP
jgi:two-component system, NtrC family, response regulator HydG